MKTTSVFLIAASVAVSSFAASSDNISLVAADVSKIPEVIASLEDESPANFASDVVNAIVKLPKNPKEKLRKLADASSSFIALAEGKALSETISSLVSSVPNEYLPGWTDLTRPSVQISVQDLPEAEYSSIVGDVVQKISVLADSSNDDKTTLTTFALKLLVRIEPEVAWIESAIKFLPSIPSSYRTQVEAAIKPTFEGSYSALLGETKIVEVPAVTTPPTTDSATVVADRVPTTPSQDQDALLPVGAEAIAQEGNVQSEGGDETPPPPAPTPVKPPVPTPYRGQF